MKFAIVEFKKFPVHGRYSLEILNLPLSTSMSATNSTGMSTGWDSITA
jgi:hypothetical protein